MDYAELITDELELREMSINELARRSGVSRDSLWCWLHGSSPKVSSLEAVLKTLGYRLAIEEDGE